MFEILISDIKRFGSLRGLSCSLSALQVAVKQGLTVSGILLFYILYQATTSTTPRHSNNFSTPS
jgi:hypothetical protein